MVRVSGFRVRECGQGGSPGAEWPDLASLTEARPWPRISARLRFLIRSNCFRHCCGGDIIHKYGVKFYLVSSHAMQIFGSPFFHDLSLTSLCILNIVMERILLYHFNK